MPDNLQPTATFPGLPPVVGARWTVSRGVLPSVCLVETLRRPITGARGSLVVSQGSVATNAAGAALIECRLRKFHHGGEGFRWVSQIVDRRAFWWRYKVSGEWNPRLPDGSIREQQKKNARELAELIFDGMEEVGYSVADVPTDVYPHVQWDGLPAPIALDALARCVGCEVAYNPFTNLSGVFKIGVGCDLPEGGNITPDATYERAGTPKDVRFVCGPSLYEFLFLLEPVGLEADGRIKAIDDLSYKPSGGWEGEWPTVFAGVAQASRHLAFKSVYRWWRVKAFADGTLDAPGLDKTLARIDQCFPLLPHRLLVGEDDDAGQRLLPPVIEGTWWPGSLLGENTATYTQCPVPFELYCENGIVKFAQPMVKFDTGQPEAAQLYLTAGCAVRKTDGDHERLTFDHEANPAGVGIQTFYRPELFLSYRNTYSSGSATGEVENEGELEADAQVWLWAKSAEYEPLTRYCEAYRGVRNVSPDGRIGQVRFTWGPKRRAETTASIGYEFDPQEPSRDERLAIARSLAERYA